MEENKKNFKFLKPKNSNFGSKKRFSISIFLLFTSLFILSVIIGWMYFFNSRENIAISVENISNTKEKKLEMTGAKYSGQSSNGTIFLITADKAIENEGKMRLFRPNGKLKTLKRGQIKLISKEAFFKTEQNNIELIGDVKIHQSTNNMTIYSEKITAILNEEMLISNFPVKLSSPEFFLTSESMTAHNYGEKIIFKGKSQIKFK